MKTNHFFTLAILLLFNVVLHAQESKYSPDSLNMTFENYKAESKSLVSVEDSTSYQEAYIKLRKLYFKTHDSEVYMKYAISLEDFCFKSNISLKDIKKLKKSQSILSWVKENFETTKFKSFEEAEKEYEAIQMADLAQYQENDDYYVYLFFVINKFGSKMLSDIMIEYEETSMNSILYRNYYMKI